jgi:hypothetical protein
MGRFFASDDPSCSLLYKHVSLYKFNDTMNVLAADNLKIIYKPEW